MKNHKRFLSIVGFAFLAVSCRPKPTPSKSVGGQKQINSDATFIKTAREWRKNEKLQIEDIISRLGKYSYTQTIDGFTLYIWNSDGRIVFSARTKIDSLHVESVACSEHY
jgi:hypothetical protein